MFCSIFPSASVWLNTDIEMSYGLKDRFGINITGNSEIFISVPDISRVTNIAYIVVLVFMVQVYICYTCHILHNDPYQIHMYVQSSWFFGNYYLFFYYVGAVVSPECIILRVVSASELTWFMKWLIMLLLLKLAS